MILDSFNKKAKANETQERSYAAVQNVLQHLSDNSVAKLLLHLAGMITVAQHTQQLHYQQQIFLPLYLPGQSKKRREQG